MIDKINKRAEAGEGVMLMYSFVIVSIIAVAIFGVASIFYDYYIDVRDAEAIILIRQVSDCISPSGVVDLNLINENKRENIFSYCGISFSERLYFSVDILDSSGNSVAKFSQGDSSFLWIKKVVDSVSSADNFEKYEPGYRVIEYPVSVLRGVDLTEGRVKMEVIVNNEF